MTPDTRKRADIQGLRGIAVLAVVLFHMGALPGGFAGVDIFFVISGYLITQILLCDDFRLKNFYERRVRRLFPALYVVLAFTLVAGLLILPPKLLSELVYTQFFTSLFLSNFAFARFEGYFDTTAGLKPLLHTWSLAVEEQFYLIYPLVLLAIRQFARRFLWPILGVLAVVSLIAAQASTKPEDAFYWPTTRAFELLIGALCLAVPPLSEKLKRALSLTGVVVIVLSLILLNDTLRFPGVWALPPCLGAAFLLVSRDAWGNRLISAPPLVWTGDISYSLYLWHWPLLVYGRLVLGESLWLAVLVVILAFGLAVLSRRYVERPFLTQRPRRLWGLAGGAMAVSILTALAVFGAKGLPERFNSQERAAFAAADDYSPDRKPCHLAQDARVAYRDTCVFGQSASIAASVAVWGDSEGVELVKALGNRGYGVRQITASACPPSVAYDIAYNPACQAHNADVLLHLKYDKAIQTVILIANYDRYRRDNPAAMMGGLELSALDLKQAGKRVIIVYPLPVYVFDPPSQVGLAMRLGRDPRTVGMDRAAFDRQFARVTSQLDTFTTQHGIETLRPSDVLCDADRCRVYDGAAGVLYFNNQHLSLKGADLLAGRITSLVPLRRAE